jgi:hypothetical protein
VLGFTTCQIAFIIQMGEILNLVPIYSHSDTQLCRNLGLPHLTMAAAAPGKEGTLRLPNTASTEVVKSQDRTKMLAYKMMCSNNTNQQREITKECKGQRVCGVANNVISNLNIFNPRARLSAYCFGRLSPF